MWLYSFLNLLKGCLYVPKRCLYVPKRKQNVITN